MALFKAWIELFIRAPLCLSDRPGREPFVSRLTMHECRTRVGMGWAGRWKTGKMMPFWCILVHFAVRTGDFRGWRGKLKAWQGLVSRVAIWILPQRMFPKWLNLRGYFTRKTKVTRRKCFCIFSNHSDPVIRLPFDCIGAF
jgi:hypothetical protein